jgi:hypothetical protein
MKNVYKIGPSTYITNNEEIKNGDYLVQINFEKTNTQLIKCEKEFQTKIANDKYGSYTKNKIIMTDDPKLISEGIQPIDEDLFNYLYNTPDCEKVHIKIYCCEKISDDYCDFKCDKQTYKVIIPKKGREYFKENRNLTEAQLKQISLCAFYEEGRCIKDFCGCYIVIPKKDLKGECVQCTCSNILEYSNCTKYCDRIFDEVDDVIKSNNNQLEKLTTEVQLKDPNTCEHYKEFGCIKDICSCYILKHKEETLEDELWSNVFAKIRQYGLNYIVLPILKQTFNISKR